MKRTVARFVLPSVLLSVGAFAQAGIASPATGASSTPAPTATAPNGPAKIGIINIQQAILLTNEGKRDLEALDKKFEPKRTELQSLQKEVQDMQNQLKTQGDKLNEESRNTLVRNIESKQKSLQRSAEDAQSDYQGQQGEIVNRVGQKMMEILDKYAKQNGYTVILDVSSQQSPVLWAGQQTDVTREIAEAYNSQSNVPAPASTPNAPTPHASTTHPSASTTAKSTPK